PPRPRCCTPPPARAAGSRRGGAGSAAPCPRRAGRRSPSRTWWPRGSLRRQEALAVVGDGGLDHLVRTLAAVELTHLDVRRTARRAHLVGAEVVAQAVDEGARQL